MFFLKTMKTTIVQSRDLLKFGSKYIFCSLAEHPRIWKVPGVPVHVSLKHPFMVFTSQMQRQKGLSMLSVTRMLVRIVPFS